MRKRRPVSGGAVLEFEITIGTRKENQLLCYKAIFQLSSLCDLVLQNVLNSAIIQGQNIFGGLERSWCPIGCQLPFLYTIRLLGGNPTQKLGEVAHPKSGLKTEIPQKSWEKSLGRNRA